MSKKKDIQKTEIDKELEALKKAFPYNVGDYLIERDGHTLKIKSINDKGVVADTHWSEDRFISWEDWRAHYDGCLKLPKAPEEMELDVLEQLKDLSKFEDNTEISDSTEVAPTMSKAALLSMQAGLEAKRKEVEILYRVLERHRARLSSLVSDFREKIEKVMEVVGILELYLGINEELFQLTKGELAKADEPICFRQQILFMDEELGDPEDGGLDFRGIDTFDNWLVKNRNFEKLIPEKKGVVVLKPRRHDKVYDENWFVNFLLNVENKKTYLLIRNGDNLYRVWTGMEVEDRLFPKKEEFESIKANRSRWHSESYIDKEVAEIKKKYLKQALMMQGLIDRSDVFRPMSSLVNIFKSEHPLVKFIYDDELTLPAGRLCWNDWHEKINKKITRGSRVLLVESWGWESKKYMKSERLSFYHSEWKELPKTGVYKVTYCGEEESCGKKNEVLKFIFNPKDDVWSWYSGSYERKKGYSFKFYRTDDFILNYDMIDLDDVEFYISCRADREHYCHMLPLLWEIKRRRIAEIKWEQDFVQLVMNRTKVDKKVVLDALRWWKYKNIWKRPITEDDAKALRMIEKRVKANG